MIMIRFSLKKFFFFGIIWASLLVRLSAQNMPFPSHVAYAAGTTRPNNVTQVSMDSTVTNFWSQWAHRYLKTAGTGGQYYVYYNLESEGDPGASTVSEAHGYGMVLSAYMAGADPSAKTYFDGLYAYYKAHPSDNNPLLMAWEQDTSFNDMGGADSATDGDMDIAYSLLLADKQWGSGGAINYFQAATNMIDAIMQSDVNQAQWTLRLGDWATSGTSKGFAYASSTRPSDFMLDHMRSYFEATGDGRWTNVINKTCFIINTLFTNNSPNTGLIPDFIVLNGATYQPAPANFLESSTDGGYGYNSCRTPWRFATDYLLRGTSECLAEERKMNAWILSNSGGNASQVYPGYNLDGTPLDTSYTDSSFTSPFGVNAMIDSTNQAWVNSLWSWDVNGGINANDGYFGNSIKMHCLIVMSGNWWMPSYISPMLNITAITSINNGIRLTWATTAGQSYVLQAASQLGRTNRFSDISSPIFAQGAGISLTNFTDTNEWTGAGTRYYRVRLGP